MIVGEGLDAGPQGRSRVIGETEIFKRFAVDASVAGIRLECNSAHDVSRFVRRDLKIRQLPLQVGIGQMHQGPKLLKSWEVIERGAARLELECTHRAAW
jgi:hypothetical protein